MYDLAMSYVDENLLPGEHVAYRARLHYIIYAAPIAAAVLGVLCMIVVVAMQGAPWVLWLGVLSLVVAAVLWLSSYIKSSSSEFAVTNRRVVIKTGIIRRHTLELLLQKVEGIGVDQTVFGRMLGLGSIVVIGTGGSREEFKNIANPLEFRHQVQAQAAGYDEQHSAGVQAAPIATGGPFCSKCGTQNPPDAGFCFKCGQRIVVA
jgi:uncharacterized membrane protein YdbT with pleckstrin-like domain